LLILSLQRIRRGFSMKGKRTASIVVAAFVIGAVALGTGCHKGPAEKAGEKVDDAVQKMKDTVDPPGPAEKAGRKVDKALDQD
jgi:hypothetical protein